MFEAVGRGGQRINVWPAKDMVLVFTGGGFEPGDLAKFILKALQSDQSLAPNPKAFAKVQQSLVDALQPPPSPDPLPELPATAARISGKTIKMSKNAFGLSELTLEFDETLEAIAELILQGHHERFGVGLGGERFSRATWVDWPVACKGQWIDQNRFLLRIDLVAGINCYDIKLNFSEMPQVSVDLLERTGLIEEHFNGTISK
jgi:hypothetical protein